MPVFGLFSLFSLNINSSLMVILSLKSPFHGLQAAIISALGPLKIITGGFAFPCFMEFNHRVSRCKYHICLGDESTVS